MATFKEMKAFHEATKDLPKDERKAALREFKAQGRAAAREHSAEIWADANAKADKMNNAGNKVALWGLHFTLGVLTLGAWWIVLWAWKSRKPKTITVQLTDADIERLRGELAQSNR